MQISDFLKKFDFNIITIFWRIWIDSEFLK